MRHLQNLDANGPEQHPVAAPSWGAETSDSLEASAESALKAKQPEGPKQANRLRYPHNLGANGPVQYPLAAPPWGAQMLRHLHRGDPGALKREEPGR